MSFKKQCTIWYVGILSAALPLSAAAQDSDLGTINVTAQRVASPSELSPKTVTVIDRKQIEAAHADNLVTLLKGQPDITVRDTSGIGAKSVVDLGGFGETAVSNTVVLVDGRRVNSPDLSGVDWAQIPVDQIERIEIVHGGSSVLYGGGAVGGVINIITRIPQKGGELSLQGGSFDTSSGSLRIGAAPGPVRLEGNLSGYSSNGYRKNSGLDRYDGGMRFELDLPGGAMLYANGNHHQDRYGLPGSLTTAQVAADRKQTLKPTDHGSSNDSYVNGGVTIPFAGAELDLPVSFRRRSTSALYGTYTATSVLHTLSLRPKLDWQSREGWYRSLVAGADIDRVRGSLSSFGAKRHRTGLYLSGNVGDADRNYILSVGVRSEKVKDSLTKAGGSSISGRKSAYDVGLVVRHERFSLHLDHNRSLRFPVLDERYDYTNKTWNSSLTAQTGRHDSIAIDYDAAPFRAGISFRRADLSHEIFYNPATFANENYSSKTRHDVLMVEATWMGADWLKLSGSYTHTRATFRGGSYAGKDIPAVPKGRFSLRWDADWKGGFASRVTVRHIGDSWLISDQNNSQPKLPAYTVVDVSGSYRWHDLKVIARIDNLTNRRYSTYGVYSSFAGTDNFYPAAGIGAYGGVDYSF